MRQETLPIAINEANRLARANPGKRFTVYRPAQTHRLRDVDVEEHRDDSDDIPF